MPLLVIKRRKGQHTIMATNKQTENNVHFRH